MELLGVGLLAEALLEPGHAASGVEDLLLAGIEGVALRADLGVDGAGRRGATGGEGVATGTGGSRLDVRGVDVALHRRSPRIDGRRVVVQAACLGRREPE